ncbi:hypothetical protein DRE_04229 [Drechslerella stenobrocha 248]|uniref:Phospholipid metabolism enzyme regulator n=1 Tax=Drechslerella stenobrocha 248 TaxID=1043628 RepID=W7HR77_9PEZI|nr:hypothetical protein DRE_04229 [Drechslerella stenobrocha 248]
MSRNNSSTNLRRDSATPNNLVDFSHARDKDPSGVLNAPTSTTPGIPSRDSSPAIPLSQPPKNRRLSSAREGRREASPSPARSISSTSIARLANFTASQSSPALAQMAGNGAAAANQQVPAVIMEQQQPLSPRPQRPIHPNVPHWPTSPRLSLSRSPPPNARSSSITSPRKPLDSTLTLPPPSMAAKDKESPGRGQSGDESSDRISYFHHYGTQRPPRPLASPAPLETVTESSLPSTPAIGMVDKSIDARLHEAEQRRQETSSMSTRPSESSISSSRTTTAQESESDTGNMSDRKPPSRAPSRTVSRRPTVTASTAKAQDASGEVKAEIETVTSIPQQINPAGTVRLTKKASQETIRPVKKEKHRKRQKRAPGPGAPTTKADIFEQRINDTLDDAESSDSEETFVYESNPADKARPRHSRTNSVTSLSDPRRQALDNTQSRPRRNMKFGTSHVYKGQTNFDDYTSDGVGSSTTRAAGSQSGLRGYIGRGYATSSTDGNNTQHVRHANHKSSHQSLRAPHHISSSRASSRPTSPRAFGNKHAGSNGNFMPKARREASQLSVYEGDAEGDADERTPLFNIGRRNGGIKSRSGSFNSRHRDRGYDRQRNWYARVACCAFAAFLMFGLVGCALGFVFLTTKPLQEVRLINITDVIAAKQEMMFNLDVHALNPNILPVTISTMDVNVFIKSPYVRDGKQNNETPSGDEHQDDGWWKNIIKGNSGEKQERKQRSAKSSQAMFDNKAPHALDGIDEGTDPVGGGPVEEEETMLLGRIFNFDSTLIFDGSPFRQDPTHAVGEVRLSRPGNKTEVGGSERWERAMVHTFDLTVRGFLRYQLPLSGRVRTATIQGTVTVHPNDDAAEGFREHVGSLLDFHDVPN